MDTAMDLNRKYSFNLPWRGVIVFTGFYVGLAVWMAHLAVGSTGAIVVCLVVLSVIFTALALIMVMRRTAFPRVLELSEDLVLFPRGFPGTRIIRIPYADIIRMSETSSSAQNSLTCAGVSPHFLHFFKGWWLSIQQGHVGFTEDLKQRLALHNSGHVPHTLKFRPWEIKTAIAFTDRQAAGEFEKYLKTASGRAFAKKRL